MNWRFCPEPRGNVRPTSTQLGQMAKNPPKIRQKEIICEIDTILFVPATVCSILIGTYFDRKRKYGQSAYTFFKKNPVK